MKLYFNYYRKNKLNITIITIISCLISFNIFSQQLNPKILKENLFKVNNDSVILKVEYSQQLMFYYSDKNSDSAIYYRNYILQLISSLNNKLKLVAHSTIIKNELLNERYDLTKQILPETYNLCKLTNNNKLLSKIYFYLGYYYYKAKHNIDSASNYYYKSANISTLENDKIMMAYVNSAIGVLYLDVGVVDSSQNYLNKAKALHLQLNDSANLLFDDFNQGTLLAYKNKLTEARELFIKVLTNSRRINNKTVELNALFNIANISNRLNENDLAENKIEELLQKSIAYNNKTSILNATSLWAAIKLNKKNYQDAINKGNEALTLAYEISIPNFITANLGTLIEANQALGNYKKAFELLQIKKKFEDSTASITNTRYLEKLKGQFNLDIKNKELLEKNMLIEQKVKDSKAKNSLIIMLILLLLFATLFFYLYKSRKKTQLQLQKQEMLNLQHRQEFNSFINGQESERKRIASDIHDGLAQNLVMLGIRIADLKSETEVETLKKAEIQKEVNQLINETRTIAHNMMPDVLTELGLHKALKSLINKLSHHHKLIKFNLVWDENINNLKSEHEIQIYRIVQELLNNCIKHSKATTCDIIFKFNINFIQLLVIDNGIGITFNNKQHGIGIQSINSRVNSINGTIKFNTKAKGLEIEISIPN